jgi:hypothetical protein
MPIVLRDGRDGCATEDDWRRFEFDVVTQSSRKLQSRPHWHHQIRYHERRAHANDYLQRFFAIGRRKNGVALSFEQKREKLRDERFIVDSSLTLEGLAAWRREAGRHVPNDAQACAGAVNRDFCYRSVEKTVSNFQN